MRSLWVHQAGLIWARIVLPTLGSRICVKFVGERDYDDSLFNRCHVILPSDNYLRPVKRHSSDQTHNFKINIVEPQATAVLRTESC